MKYLAISIVAFIIGAGVGIGAVATAEKQTVATAWLVPQLQRELNRIKLSQHSVLAGIGALKVQGDREAARDAHHDASFEPIRTSWTGMKMEIAHIKSRVESIYFDVKF